MQILISSQVQNRFRWRWHTGSHLLNQRFIVKWEPIFVGMRNYNPRRGTKQPGQIKKFRGRTSDNIQTRFHTHHMSIPRSGYKLLRADGQLMQYLTLRAKDGWKIRDEVGGSKPTVVQTKSFKALGRPRKTMNMKTSDSLYAPPKQIIALPFKDITNIHSGVPVGTPGTNREPLSNENSHG